jgi:hypothetical protein
MRTTVQSVRQELASTLVTRLVVGPLAGLEGP